MNWYKKAQKEECKGWLAVRLSSKEKKKIQEWSNKNITEDMLCKEEGGRELDTHITVVYGICAKDTDIIKSIFKNKKTKIKATLKNIGFFKPDKNYEPLIIKVESKDLEKLNEEISNILHIESTHDEYKPHCTIAYIKKGEANKFAGNKIFNGIELTLDKIVFINTNKEEIEIKL